MSADSADTGPSLRTGENGATYQIGDKGVKVGYFRIVENGQEVLFSTPKEVWSWTLEKVKIIIDGCQGRDFFFETILVQQCLVMLVTGYEVYCKGRFMELEKQGKIPNHDALLNEFVGKDERQKVIEYSTATGKSIAQSLIDKNFITFQSWECCKLAYNKGYSIKFGELGLSNKVLPNLQKYIKWRHKIIHSKYDMALLNSEESQENWIFANKKFIIDARQDFIEFMESLHSSTLSLK